MKKNGWILLVNCLVCTLTFWSCRNNTGQEEKAVRAVVPVTIISPRTGKMSVSMELMATSAFLVKASVKSPVTGYVEKSAVSPGDNVARNQVLFQVRTKEAAALQHDTLGAISLSGMLTIKASIQGVVATIEHPQGDYVQEGDILCTLVVPSSLVFLLDAPFGLKPLVRTGSECRLLLPDNSEIIAEVRSVLPSMTGSSQTQRIVLQPRTVTNIPENLMAKVKVVRQVKNNAVILPKTCILNDEIMKNYWVMKMVNDTLAVKVPVQPGMTETDSVEILSPVLLPADRILSGGNYGLGDSAVVRIIRQK